MDISLVEIAGIIDKVKGPNYFGRELSKTLGEFITKITTVPDDAKVGPITDALLKDQDGKLLDFAQKAQDQISKQFKELGLVMWKQIKNIKSMNTDVFIRSLFGNTGANAPDLSLEQPSRSATEHQRGAVEVEVTNTNSLASALGRILGIRRRTNTQSNQADGNDNDGEQQSLFSKVFGFILKWGGIAGIAVAIGTLWNNNPALRETVMRVFTDMVKLIKKAWGKLGDFMWNTVMNKNKQKKFLKFIWKGLVGAFDIAKSLIGTLLHIAFDDAWNKFMDGDFLGGLKSGLMGVLTFVTTWFVLSKLPVIGNAFQLITKGAFGAVKLVTKGLGALMTPAGAVIAATVVAGVQVAKAYNAFKDMREEQRAAEEARRYTELQHEKLVETGRQKVLTLEEQIDKLKQFDPKTEEERLRNLKAIASIERKQHIQRMNNALDILNSGSAEDQARGNEVKKKILKLRQEALVGKLSVLGDKKFTDEILAAQAKMGTNVDAKNRFREMQKELNRRVGDNGELLIAAIEKQTDVMKDGTEQTVQTIAEGAIGQINATNSAASSTAAAIGQSANSQEINVKSTVEFERIFGFREMARSFIYPDRLGMKSS